MKSPVILSTGDVRSVVVVSINNCCATPAPGVEAMGLLTGHQG